MDAFNDFLAWLASMFHALTGKLTLIWETQARPLLRVLGACIWSVLVLWSAPASCYSAGSDRKSLCGRVRRLTG